ncbi:MAG: DUF58 domain-containing protein [Burkholderiales bacterium]
MTAAGGLPRHVPRGARSALDDLLALRRYGAAMRRLLALDAERDARTRTARAAGMDYAESRPYAAGDDVRRIDWRVTARTGRAHTKLYRMERGRDVCAIADQRAPMRFGTRAAFKSVVAAELAALAGWAAAEGGDRFGALVAGAGGAHIRPGEAELAVAGLCAALAAPGAGEDAPLDALASRAAAASPPGTRFFVASDFADDESVLLRAVGTLRARGDAVLVWVHDSLELRLPPPARYPLTDGRDALVLDTGSRAVRAAHSNDAAARRRSLARLAAFPGVRVLAVRSGEDLFAALARGFPAQTA